MGYWFLTFKTETTLFAHTIALADVHAWKYHKSTINVSTVLYYNYRKLTLTLTQTLTLTLNHIKLVMLGFMFGLVFGSLVFGKFSVSVIKEKFGSVRCTAPKIR